MSAAAERKMQGRTSRLALVTFTATMIMAGCGLPQGDDTDVADAGDDYAQVCTDLADDAEPDADCATSPQDWESDSPPPNVHYVWRYYPASNLVIVPYGARMSGGMVSRPKIITVGTGGGSRPAKIQVPSAGPSGKTLPKPGTSSSSSSGGLSNTTVKSTGSPGISRGGFGVKGGGSTPAATATVSAGS